MATETLSEYLERDISAASIFDIKLKVQDKTRYYRKFQRLSVVTSGWYPLACIRVSSPCRLKSKAWVSEDQDRKAELLPLEQIS